jgi:SAM-dependent methyltransferase
MSSKKLYINFVNNYLKPFNGMRILDIGCGTAEILNYLDGVDYVGFDINSNYIQNARAKFVNGKFYCKSIDIADINDLPSFDVVICLGFLHHIDEDIGKNIIDIAYKALKPEGRLLAIDPCFIPSQNIIAELLIKGDRGQNVRDKYGYEKLARNSFEECKTNIEHQVWIPYTRCFMECEKKMNLNN